MKVITLQFAVAITTYFLITFIIAIFQDLSTNRKGVRMTPLWLRLKEK